MFGIKRETPHQKGGRLLGQCLEQFVNDCGKSPEGALMGVISLCTLQLHQRIGGEKVKEFLRALSDAPEDAGNNG